MVDRERIRALFGVSDCFAPAVSPSGDAIAYRWAGGGGTELRLLNLSTGDDRRLASDLPPVNREPLYWLPDGDRLASIGGAVEDHALELVSREGERDRLVDADGRVHLFDTEPGAVWYWAVDEATLYRHPVGGDRTAVASVDPVATLSGGVSSERVAVSRLEDGTVAPHVLHRETGEECRLDDAAGWTAHARPWTDEGRLLLSPWYDSGAGVYDLATDGFVWRDESVGRPVAALSDGDVLAVREWTPVVGRDGDWREFPVDGAAVASPMASEEVLLPDGRAVLARMSSTRPREFVALDLADGDAELLVAAEFGDVDPEDVVTPERVTYPSPDGEAVDALLYRPVTDAPAPAVVTMYPPQPDPTPGLDWSAQLLVEAGYAVLWAGHSGEPLAQDAHREYAAAGAWLADRPDVDGERLAFYGHSSGGEAALRQAFRHPDAWAAVVDWAGFFDMVWAAEAGELPAGYVADLPDYEADPDLWRERSPATHADGLDVPLLAMYGRRDSAVPLEHSRRLLDAVPDDAPLEYHEFDAGHGTSGEFDVRVAVWATILEFLDRRLGSPGDST
ncbi:hypothetical protein BRC95_11825 [Halobacteriales archaeon QS_5_68_33]|nr:MAG: hypothetical protein BRC95_11825 [Halobacteriales archaeon QS_5_68_33]